MRPADVLAIDVGGSHVKLLVSADGVEPRRFLSGPDLSPRALVDHVAAATDDWSYETVSIGVPAPVHAGRIVSQPASGRGLI